jgi:aspartate aminotransferase
LDISLSRRVQAIKLSPTLAVSGRAAELAALGRDVINLGAGELDFDTPAHIKEAAKTAIDLGFTKYTMVEGIPELRNAIVAKLKRDNNLTYGARQILVSCGAKQSIYNALQALLNPGDEAIVPAPYWVSYPDMIKLADGTPVIINTSMEIGFKLTADQLEAALTPKTRVVILNSPSNPTGMCYTRMELAALGEVLVGHPNVVIISDDIYEQIRWSDDPFSNIINACPALYDRSIVVNGVSKAYAMTGWRLGYSAAPEAFTNAMKKIQGQSTSNATSISQVAAAAALNGDQQCVRNFVKILKDRHDFVVARLNRQNGVRCLPAQGAFYAFPNVRTAIDRNGEVENDLELAELLIERYGIAVVPGTAFGAPGFLRLDIAASMETLTRAMDRFDEAFGKS